MSQSAVISSQLSVCITLGSFHTGDDPTVWKSPPDYRSKGEARRDAHAGSSLGALTEAGSDRGPAEWRHAHLPPCESARTRAVYARTSVPMVRRGMLCGCFSVASITPQPRGRGRSQQGCTTAHMPASPISHTFHNANAHTR